MGKVPINLAPVWKKRSYKLKYWNNLATILQTPFVCKTISRIKKKKWTMSGMWEMRHIKNKYGAHRNMYSHEEVLNKLSRNSREQVRTWLADIHNFCTSTKLLNLPFHTWRFYDLYSFICWSHCFLATITIVKRLGKSINIS